MITETETVVEKNETIRESPEQSAVNLSHEIEIAPMMNQTVSDPLPSKSIGEPEALAEEIPASDQEFDVSEDPDFNLNIYHHKQLKAASLPPRSSNRAKKAPVRYEPGKK